MSTSIRIEALKEKIGPVRKRLIAHPLYGAVRTGEALRKFMEYHVYAVWDFMSLLKALQRDLTCVDVPWVVRGNADTRYLINEIVVGEESDIDEQGKRVSHYELYLRAMEQAGASSAGIRTFIDSLASIPIAAAIDRAELPAAVKKFLQFTFDTIASREPHSIAAVFTFGREDLIPDLFLPLVQELERKKPGDFGIFLYYLQRHIEVDGGHHSHLAMAMVEELCGDSDDKWDRAAEAAIAALEARIVLWDGVVEALA